MRKAVLAIEIMVIIILMQPMEQGVIVRANVDSKASIVIKSPLRYENYEYNTSSVNISVAVYDQPLPVWFKAMTGMYETSISYSLDGKPDENLSLSVDFVGNYSQPISDGILGTGTLNNLVDGYHSLKIVCGGYFSASDSIIFLVNATNFHSPSLLLSPLNTTYIKNNVPLTYAVNISKYLVFYRLDNSDYIYTNSNTTLSGLLDGQHTIYIQAINGDNLYSEQTTCFNVNTTINQSIIILVLAVSAFAVFLAVAIVIYRRRRISK